MAISRTICDNIIVCGEQKMQKPTKPINNNNVMEKWHRFTSHNGTRSILSCGSKASSRTYHFSSHHHHRRYNVCCLMYIMSVTVECNSTFLWQNAVWSQWQCSEMKNNKILSFYSIQWVVYVKHITSRGCSTASSETTFVVPALTFYPHKSERVPVCVVCAWKPFFFANFSL